MVHRQAMRIITMHSLRQWLYVLTMQYRFAPSVEPWLFYRYIVLTYSQSYSWVLVKVSRAKIHRADQCDPGCRMELALSKFDSGPQQVVCLEHAPFTLKPFSVDSSKLFLSNIHTCTVAAGLPIPSLISIQFYIQKIYYCTYSRPEYHTSPTRRRLLKRGRQLC